jgi:hypothetical protein
VLKAAILINPTSGKGRSAKNAPRAVARLRERGVDVTALQADSADASLKLAHEAVAGGVDALIACGGDGTVHLALQAVYGTDTALGIIPVGTGDDIARGLDLPRDDPAAAADVIADGRTRMVDYAVINADGRHRARLPGGDECRFRLGGDPAGQHHEMAHGHVSLSAGHDRRTAGVQTRRIHHRRGRPGPARAGDDARDRQRGELWRRHEGLSERPTR